MIIFCYDPLVMSGGRLVLLVAFAISLVACVVARWWAKHNEDSQTEWLATLTGLASVVSVGVVIAQLWFEEGPEPRPSDDPATSQTAGSRSRAPDEKRTSPTTTAEPITTPAPSASLPSEVRSTPTYRLEHKDVPLAIRSPGTCESAYTVVDFDGDPFGDGPPITRRVVDWDALTSSEREAIDMYYETCVTAVLSVSPGSSVGLLRKGEAAEEVTAEQCAAAASGASIGGELRIDNSADARDAGFEVGASLCARTPQGRVAKATITHISYESGFPAVEFTLTTWVRASS